MDRILIINQHFKAGGIKKTLVVLVNELAKYYDIDIQFLETPKEMPIFEGNVVVLSKLRLINLYKTSKADLKQQRFYVFKFFIKALLKIIEKLIGSERLTHILVSLSRKNKIKYACVMVYSHDLVIHKQFTGGCNLYAQKKTSAERYISWIHGELDSIGLNRERVLKTYKGFDCVVCVSKTMQHSFENAFGDLISSVYIRNMYNYENIKTLSQHTALLNSTKKRDYTFITVTRLDSTFKRADKINRISSRLVEKGVDFSWLVVGGGTNLTKLQEESKGLGVSEFVNYLGEKSNPYPFIANADALIIVSDSEAYPTVIVEAQILGVPVITTNYPSAYELVDDKKNGLITNKDEHSIYEAIMTFCTQKSIFDRINRYSKSNSINNEESIQKIRNIVEERKERNT